MPEPRPGIEARRGGSDFVRAPAADALDGTRIRLGPEWFDVFAGCNYHALAQHPRVIEAARDAMSDFGLSASASRTTSGETTVYRRLEQDLTIFLGRGDVLLTPDGYTANLAAAQALASPGAVALLDERAHPSLHDAARLAGFEPHVFAHLNPRDLARRLGKLEHAPRVVVMTDGVFTADGSIAPVPDLLAALPTRDATLLIDDCHGFTVLGDHGRGSLDHHGVRDHRIVLTSTLAKGLGAGGGFVCASPGLIAKARTHSSAFVCTTPTSPVLAAAAREALTVLRKSSAGVDRLRARSARLAALLSGYGLSDLEHQTPIVAIPDLPGLGAEALSRHLYEQRIICPRITYPGGPAPCYVRVALTSAHTDAQVDRLFDSLRAALDRGQAASADASTPNFAIRPGT